MQNLRKPEIQDKRMTGPRARVRELLYRSSFDLKLAEDAARSTEDISLVRAIRRVRHEVETLNSELPAA